MPRLAAPLGSQLAIWVTFRALPGPDLRRRAFHGGPARQCGLGAALTAVTAAVAGMILPLAVCFALHVIFGEVVGVPAGPLALGLPRLATSDRAVALSALALLALFRLKLGIGPVPGVG